MRKGMLHGLRLLVAIGFVGCQSHDDADDTLDICTAYCRQANECAGIEGEELEDELKYCPSSCADGIRAEEEAQGAACGAASRALHACLADLPCKEMLDQTACSREIVEYDSACGDGDGTPDT